MVDYQENVSSCLLFYDLIDREFNVMVGSWQDGCYDFDFYDFFLNLNKFDECDLDLMLNIFCLEYYLVCDFNKMLVNLDVKFFLIFYCNIRSLFKNLNLLEELLCFFDFKLDIFGIIEIKLGEKFIFNVNIKGYNFFYMDLLINVGGVVLYIVNSFYVVFRLDIKFEIVQVEFCWVEIDVDKGKKKIIIGCIYKYFICNLEQFCN